MENYKSPFPPPTDFEAELLRKLGEECVEVTHRVFKALSFGLEEVQKSQDETNKQRLSVELGQLFYVFELCLKFNLVDAVFLERGSRDKLPALKKYMQHCPPGGWESIS